jgi:hypothetical protein
MNLGRVTSKDLFQRVDILKRDQEFGWARRPLKAVHENKAGRPTADCLKIRQQYALFT